MKQKYSTDGNGITNIKYYIDMEGEIGFQNRINNIVRSYIKKYKEEHSTILLPFVGEELFCLEDIYEIVLNIIETI